MVAVQVDEEMFYKTTNSIHAGEEIMKDNPDKERSVVAANMAEKHTNYERSDHDDESEDIDDEEQRSDSALEEEEDMEEYSENGDLKCAHCVMTFHWKSNLLRHQEDHQEDRLFPCENCDKTFTDPSNLQRHIRTQHIGARSHTCPECGKTFATSSGLKQHTHIHSSIKPFICEVCLKSYTQFSNLCRHKRMHADCRTQLKCNTCGQSFTTITSLNKHRRFCHSAGQLLNKQLSPSATVLPQQSHPPSILPHSPPLRALGVSPLQTSSALYQASIAQMCANFQLTHQAILAQSIGKGLIPSPYLIGYPHFPPHPSMYGMNPAAIPGLMEGSEKFLSGIQRSKDWMKFSSPSKSTSPSEEEQRVLLPHEELKRASPFDRPSSSEVQSNGGSDSEKETDASLHKRRKLIPEALPRPSPLMPECHSPRSDHSPSISSLSHSIDAIQSNGGTSLSKTAFTPVSRSSSRSPLPEKWESAFSRPEKTPRPSEMDRPIKRKAEEPLDLTIQKESLSPNGQRSPSLPILSPQKNGYYAKVDFVERNHPSRFLPFGYPPALSTMMDPIYKVNHDHDAAEEYRASAMRDTIPSLHHFSHSRFLSSPSAAFMKYQAIQGRQFPFNNSMMYTPPTTKDMVIRGKDRYTCKFCGKLFPRSANLTRHLRTHTGEQPYSCKYCDRSFSISSNLQRHVRNIHNKEKPFKCSLCDRCFGQQTNLDRHLKKHEHEQNGEISTTNPKKQEFILEKLNGRLSPGELEEKNQSYLSGMGRRSPAKCDRADSPSRESQDVVGMTDHQTEAVRPSASISPLVNSSSDHIPQPLKLKFKLAQRKSPSLNEVLKIIPKVQETSPKYEIDEDDDVFSSGGSDNIEDDNDEPQSPPTFVKVSPNSVVSPQDNILSKDEMDIARRTFLERNAKLQAYTMMVAMSDEGNKPGPQWEQSHVHKSGIDSCHKASDAIST